MKRKESFAAYHPSRFLHIMLQTLVIFALFGIGLSDDKTPETKETTSVVTSSAIPTTLPAIRIDKSLADLQYGSNDKDSINFVLYPPAEECYIDDKASFDLSISGYEPLVIEWVYNSVVNQVWIYKKSQSKEFVEMKEKKRIEIAATYGGNRELVTSIGMSISRSNGDNKIKLDPKDKVGKGTFKCIEDIVDPFKLSYSNVKTKDGCELKIELLNAYVYTTTTSTTPSTTTTSATTLSGNTTTSAATSSSAPTTTSQNTIIGLAPLSFGLIFGGIGLLLVLLVAGLLLYFLWWRKRGTDKEEEKEKEVKNEKPHPPGISPETMAKLLAMKPKVFPLTEKQKQIKAGAMAEEDDYPTEVSDDSGFGPVQSDPDSKNSESTSDQSSKTDSKRRSSKNKSTKKNGNTPLIVG